MAKLGMEKRPLVLRVRTQEQAEKVALKCPEHGWRYVIGIEHGEREEISDLERALNPPQPTSSTKLGRNEPCSCGSRRKFKRHCAQ